MQIREYIHQFIRLCIIFVMVTLVTGSLAAQEKADSLFLLETTTLLAPDSLIFVQDSVPTDTLTGDTIKEKPLFEDIIAYDAQDSLRFSVEQKKVFLYGKSYLQTDRYERA